MTAFDAIVGGGPTALACALFTARRRPVTLAAKGTHIGHRSVEAVPAATLTLLLELGITPDELGVDRLVRERVTHWSGAEPETAPAPVCAHLDTAALYEALRRRVHASTAITRTDRWNLAHQRSGWIDATGARAVSSPATLRPRPVWTAALVTIARAGADDRLHLACGADGYAYRLGSAHWLTIGWVAPGRPPMTGAALAARIAAAGAYWLLAGCRIPAAQRTFRRPASAALPQPAGTVTPIGDAALTRDALASQGLSIGLSDASLAADDGINVEHLTARYAEARWRHLTHLIETFSTAGYADYPVWRDYRRWVTGTAVALSNEQAWGAARVAGLAPLDH